LPIDKPVDGQSGSPGDDSSCSFPQDPPDLRSARDSAAIPSRMVATLLRRRPLRRAPVPLETPPQASGESVCRQPAEPAPKPEKHLREAAVQLPESRSPTPNFQRTKILPKKPKTNDGRIV